MEENLSKRLKTTKERVEFLDAELVKDEVISDTNEFKKLMKERADLNDIYEKYLEYLMLESNLEDARLMVNDNDPEIRELGREEEIRIAQEIESIPDQLKVLMIPKDPNDGKNIIIEIRGAAGGDEANIFAGDLFRLYTRYAERNGWKIQMLDESSSDAGGFSFVSFLVKGSSVYSKLKYEGGVHRVQRVPRTEASGRIHTSTASVAVLPEAEEVDIEIRGEDLQVDTYRSQGAGGQNVNKTESAVRITHIPTGVVVSCQTEKSQIQNREICMRMLRAKILDMKQQEQDEKEGSKRKNMIGSGDRSEKIRTYNYPQNRVSDHRAGITLQKLDRIMEGDLDEIIDSLINLDQQKKLEGIED